MSMTVNENNVNAAIEILNILAKYQRSVSDVDEIISFIRNYISKNTVIAKQDFRSKLDYLLKACDEK